MLTLLIGILLGVAAAVAMVRGRARLGPGVERLLLGSAPPQMQAPLSAQVVETMKADAPAFLDAIREDPAVPVEDQPAELPKASVEEIRHAKDPEAAKAAARRWIKNPDVADAMAVLLQWEPKMHFTEDKYHRSLKTHLLKQGYQGRLTEKPSLVWKLDEEESRKATPDFILGDPGAPTKRNVLLELKADLISSSETDRALGQMLRYLLAWKSGGAAILLVGGLTTPLIRGLVRVNVDNWRQKMRCPVMVHFLRYDTATEAMADIPVSEAE